MKTIVTTSYDQRVVWIEEEILDVPLITARIKGVNHLEVEYAQAEVWRGKGKRTQTEIRIKLACGDIAVLKGLQIEKRASQEEITPADFR